MFGHIKPRQEIKAREIEIDFFEEDVGPLERPKVKLLFEIKRHRLA
ncbi:hypothetical protein [Thermococcus aciditolerans]|nr:hypothetical protein [Thermococcus aciditolerans]